MLKIGVLVSLSNESDIELEFKKIYDADLDCCQLSIWDTSFYRKDNADAIIKAAQKYNVEITALWAGWSGPMEWNFIGGPSTLGLVPPAFRNMRLNELIAASDFAKLLGVTDIITHVGFLPEEPNNQEFVGVVSTLRYLCQLMKERGQYFLFETGQETPVTMLRAITQIGTGNVGINLDTANLILYGKANTLDALDVFGEYVRNTHCKDGFYPTDPMELGKEVALGQGKANIHAVVMRLIDLGYTGPLIIEREISGEEQLQDIIAARNLLRDIMRTSQ